MVGGSPYGEVGGDEKSTGLHTAPRTMSSASSFSASFVSRGNREYEVSELPLVKCPFCKSDATIVERKCKKPDNLGRKFYRCLTGQYVSLSPIFYGLSSFWWIARFGSNYWELILVVFL